MTGTWLEHVENPTFVRSMFPTRPQPLGDVDLHEITCKRDGPDIVLRFDLCEMPEAPPRKWVLAGHDTVQIQLALMGTSACSIAGWGRRQRGRITVEADADRLRVEFKSEACVLVATCDEVRIARVSGYHSGPKDHPGNSPD